MVGTPLLLGQDSNSSVTADTSVSDALVVSLSRALAANDLGLVGVVVMQQTGEPATPTITGGGVTWSLVTTNPFRELGTRASIFVFAGKSAAPSGTSITVTAGAPYRHLVAQVIEVADGDSEFVQVAQEGARASVVSTTIDTMADPVNNAFVGFAAFTRNGVATRNWVVDTENGYSVLDSVQTVDGNDVMASLASFYNVGVEDEDPLVGVGLSGGVDYIGLVVVEIAEAGAVEPDPPPEITSVNPNTGSESGGTSITITGTGFQPGATVTIGGNAATNVTVVDATTITCSTPAGSPGAADVVVTNPDSQSDTLVGGFTYTADVTPVVSEPVAFVEDAALNAAVAATHIAGTVTMPGDPDPVAVADLAVIALRRSDAAVQVQRTDAQGRYVFAGLAPGESYMVMPEVHEDTGTFYRANPAIRTPSVNGD